MKKLFVVVGKCKGETDDGKEICQFIVDDDGVMFRGTENIRKLSGKKIKHLITVVEQMLAPLLRANLDDEDSQTKN